MAKFSIEEAVGFGWKTVKANWTTLIPLSLSLFIVNGIVSALIRNSHNYNLADTSARSLISIASGNILNIMVSVIISAILIRIALQYVDGKATDFASLFKGITPELLLKIVAATVLLYLIVALGFIAFIIPGIYFAVRYSMVNYVLVDKDTTVLNAFGESSRLMKNAKWQFGLFGVVCVLIIILGLIVFFVGVIVALPVVLVASAHAYRQLTKNTEETV